MSAIPIRMLNEIQYCERLFHLMHVQKLFEESSDTIEGSRQHAKAEKNRRRSDTAPEHLWGASPLTLHLGDENLRLVGKLDSVKLEGEIWVPVEAKHSSSPENRADFSAGSFSLSGEAWPNDQIQLCAQGLLLRANGYPSDFGFLYYRGNKKKVRIDFTDSLISATLRYIERARQLEEENMPKPLVDSSKCFRCSLNYLCMPDETNYLLGNSQEIRRIVPGRIDGGVLYVSEPGTYLSLSGETIVVSRHNEKLQEIPIKDIVHVSLMGNVQCSTQLLHNLLSAGVSISHLSSHGKLIGTTAPLTTKNVHLRQQQFLWFSHPEKRLNLAQSVMFAKISNQRTLLRRNGQPNASELREMQKLRDSCYHANNADSLRGLEGFAAKIYLEHFPSMVKLNVPNDVSIMNGRNRRPPKDPVNCLLSFGYTLLIRDVTAACASVGFDPLFGFFHRMENGRPALALDMMEPYRPLIVDSVVLRVLNTGEIELSDFYWGQDSCQLKKHGRNAFFTAYERRMNETITHPLFGYKISYRRMLELETRFLARFLEGELHEYHPLITR